MLIFVFYFIEIKQNKNNVVLVLGVQQSDSVIDIYVYTHIYLLLFSRSFMADSLETPWTVAPQAPLAMGFYRQEYWSGLPFPSPGDLLSQGSNLHLLYWQVDSLSLSH